MAMRSHFVAASPEDIEVEMVLQMPVRDWRRLAAQMDVTMWPASELAGRIRIGVRAMVETFGMHEEPHAPGEQDVRA